MKYTNPIISGFHPDPSVARVGEDFYLVTSSFEYFPGVPIFHSRDLVNWAQIGHCLTKKSQLNLDKIRCSGGIFAPTIRYHDGVFYMITTNVDGGGNFFVYTDDPYGQWSDAVWLDSNDNLGFDPSLLFDEGRVFYHRRHGESVVQTEINIETGELIKPMQTIDIGRCSSDIEGPHLYKINDFYYLMAAEGGTRHGHMETIARSTSPYGPFERCPHNPILTQRHESCAVVRDTGHGELFDDLEGNWWIVFLGTRHYSYDGFTILGRETFLAPVEWVDGWPVVNQNESIELDMHVSNRKDVKAIKENIDLETFFQEGELHCSFNYVRNPDESNYRFDVEKNRIGLLGSCVKLTQEDSVTFLGVRQRHFRGEVSVSIDFDCKNQNEEAGITAYMNTSQHYKMGIRKSEGKRHIFFARTMLDLSVTIDEHKIETGNVRLYIEFDKDVYQFFYSVNGGEKVFIANALCKFLASELSGGFTGVYIGMYATGNGEKSKEWANFSNFIYRGN